jgi:nucleotide-binding universal stress UspA family protein
MAALQSQPVVVGVDGSQAALRAVRWAVGEAGRRQVPLRLVTASGWRFQPSTGPQRPGVDYRDVLLERARAHLTPPPPVAPTAAARKAPGLAIEQQLVVGSAISVLCTESMAAQVVIIGDRGLSRIEGLLVGSVTVALAVHALCPVVVVRGDETDQDLMLPVLLGVDGSSTSEAATAFAFEAASARGVVLVAMHTWSDMMFDPSMAAVVIDWTAVAEAESQVMTDRLAGWMEKFPDVTVEQVVTRDSPARHLLARAQQSQLVVVGSRGHGEFAGMVLGSVSNALLHRSPCPVAVVRTDRP